jgi:hypothetical protein
MKLPHIRRVLFATVPVTVAMLGLTAGTAYAMPDNPCEDLAHKVNVYYDQYHTFYNFADEDWAEGNNDLAEDEWIIGQHAYMDYESALSQAAAYGCF